MDFHDLEKSHNQAQEGPDPWNPPPATGLRTALDLFADFVDEAYEAVSAYLNSYCCTVFTFIFYLSIIQLLPLPEQPITASFSLTRSSQLAKL